MDWGSVPWTTVLRDKAKVRGSVVVVKAKVGGSVVVVKAKVRGSVVVVVSGVVCVYQNFEVVLRAFKVCAWK
jgi:hypothetical protein